MVTEAARNRANQCRAGSDGISPLCRLLLPTRYRTVGGGSLLSLTGRSLIYSAYVQPSGLAVGGLITAARIRDTAIEVFGEHGFQVGVRKIAAAAGVSA
ncbi:TetR family transcriptional regulator, partial [Nocardia sp. NPDC004260]